MEGNMNSRRCRRRLDIANESDLIANLDSNSTREASSEFGGDNENYDSDKDSEYRDPGSPSYSSSSEDEHYSPIRQASNHDSSVLTVNQSPPAAASTPPAESALTVESAIQEATRVPKNKARKRSADLAGWKRNKRAKRFNKGIKIINGVEIQRQVGERCNCKRKKCIDITDDQREDIQRQFWSDNSTAEKRHAFIIGHTEKKAKIRGVLAPAYHRGENVSYFLSVQNRKIPVCERFFLSTLSISKKTVHYNLRKTVNGVRMAKPPKAAPNKISASVFERIIDHIKLFPTVESHYCRKDSQRQYLDTCLNIRQMYRLYCEMHPENPPSETYYRRVFTENFNLSFYKPSKDQCDTCDVYSKTKESGSLTDELEAKQEAHIRRKNAARSAKESDKALADNTLAVCFDLQQVLTLPRLFAAKSYYKRKLNMYNLTFYELQTKLGHCYTWTEAEGKRGANEVATCVIKFLESIDASARYSTVILYSDTCGGQNRNRHLITAIVSFLIQAANITRIEQKYFEPGHSHMECDSMHSAIEERFKNREIDLPSDYIGCMRSARKTGTGSYKVTEISHTDFISYSELNSSAFSPGAFSGLMKTHHIIYEKDGNRDPVVSMSDEIGCHRVQISYRKRGGKVNLTQRAQAYDQPIGIPSDKKADLLSLVDHMTNKTIAQLYYNSLPVN